MNAFITGGKKGKKQSKLEIEAEEVPLQLRAQAALTEDQHLSTNLVTHNHLNAGPRGSHAFSDLSEHQAYTYAAQAYIQEKTLIHTK